MRTKANQIVETLVVSPDGVYGLTYSGDVWKIKDLEWVPITFPLIQGEDDARH